MWVDNGRAGGALGQAIDVRAGDGEVLLLIERGVQFVSVFGGDGNKPEGGEWWTLVRHDSAPRVEGKGHPRSGRG